MTGQHRGAPDRRAFTLIEMVVVCAIIGVATAITAPRMRGALDAMAVEAAAREVTNALALGRMAALRFGDAAVRVDSAGVTVSAGGATVLARDLVRAHGVRVRSSAPVVRYASTGVAVGLSNASIIIARGARADTLFVSRLGRVRR